MAGGRGLSRSRRGNWRARPCAGFPPGSAAPGTPPGACCTELRGASEAPRLGVFWPSPSAPAAAERGPALPCPARAAAPPPGSRICRILVAGPAAQSLPRWAPQQQQHAAPGRAQPPPSTAPRPPHGECRPPRTCPRVPTQPGVAAGAGPCGAAGRIRRAGEPESGGARGARGRGRLSESAPGCPAWLRDPSQPPGSRCLIELGGAESSHPSVKLSALSDDKLLEWKEWGGI